MSVSEWRGKKWLFFLFSLFFPPKYILHITRHWSSPWWDLKWTSSPEFNCLMPAKEYPVTSLINPNLSPRFLLCTQAFLRYVALHSDSIQTSCAVATADILSIPVDVKTPAFSVLDQGVVCLGVGFSPPSFSTGSKNISIHKKQSWWNKKNILFLILPRSGNRGLEIQYKGSVFWSIWHIQEL